MQEEAILTLSTRTGLPWNKGKLIGAKPPLSQTEACLGNWRLNADKDHSCHQSAITAPEQEAEQNGRLALRFCTTAILCAAAHESAFGPKQTFLAAPPMSAFGGKQAANLSAPELRLLVSNYYQSQEITFFLN